MIFGGLQKTSLIDFPGRPASVAFTQGCGWSCPYCHNAALIPDRCESPIPADEIIEWVSNRPERARNLVITGGEPTRHPDLPDFLREARQRGIRLKLDTNGCHPEMLQKILDEDLVEYVAMDMKGPLEKYASYCGRDGFAPKVEESIRILKRCRIPYEFRTTVVPQLHQSGDISRLASQLREGRILYLQPFRSQNAQSTRLRTSPEPTPELLADFSHKAREWIPVEIRD